MKVRVLHFVESLQRAGTGFQLLRFLKHSDQKRLEHRVLQVFAGPLEREIAQLGIGITTLGIRRKYDPRILTGFLRCIFQFQPHCLHSYLAQPNLLAAAAGHLSGVRLVVLEEQGIELWKSPAWVFAERFLYRRCDRVVANAEAVAGIVAQRTKLPVSRIQVLPTGVEPDAYDRAQERRDAMRAKLALAPEDLCIGTVTRLHPLKANAMLLRAAAPLITARSARCLIIGQGPEEAALRSEAERLGIAGQVNFLGLRTDVPALLAAMDIFAHTSTEEGLPSAVQEAMAAGKAIVATDAGGTRELIRHSHTGILIAVNDMDALQHALWLLAESGEMRERLGRAARREAQRYDWSRLARRRDEFYLAHCAPTVSIPTETVAERL